MRLSVRSIRKEAEWWRKRRITATMWGSFLRRVRHAAHSKKLAVSCDCWSALWRRCNSEELPVLQRSYWLLPSVNHRCQIAAATAIWSRGRWLCGSLSQSNTSVPSWRVRDETLLPLCSCALVLLCGLMPNMEVQLLVNVSALVSSMVLFMNLNH